MNKSIHSDDQARFQKLIRDLRKEANLTQAQLADRLNTPTSRICNYEKGNRRMDMVQLKEYCAALGITLHQFIDRFDTQES